MINLNRLSFEASQKILELDRSFIGTKDYMGLAYFWAHEYRHYMRDSTAASLIKIHSKLLDNGLALDGISDEHFEIIKKYHKLKKGI